MDIREATCHDLSPLLKLYTYLHENNMPTIDDEIQKLWNTMMTDMHHHIIVGSESGTIICSCVLIIVPNLTHNQRPYAFIENMITHPEYRNRGYGTQILNYAKGIAVDCKCYKIMLMTGSKKSTTLNFYKRAGYNTDDKTAFIQWLE